MVGVAVKVMFAPAQTGPAGAAAIVTDGIKIGFTVMFTGALVATAGDGQAELLVI